MVKKKCYSWCPHLAAFPVSRKADLGQPSHPPILEPCWSQIRARNSGATLPATKKKHHDFSRAAWNGSKKVGHSMQKAFRKLIKHLKTMQHRWATHFQLSYPEGTSIFSWSSIQPIRKLLGFHAGKGRILPRGTRYVLVSTRLQNLTIFNIKKLWCLPATWSSAQLLVLDRHCKAFETSPIQESSYYSSWDSRLWCFWRESNNVDHTFSRTSIFRNVFHSRCFK